MKTQIVLAKKNTHICAMLCFKPNLIITCMKKGFNATQNKMLKQLKNQRWSRGHKARGQGHKKNPRPRPRPRTAFPRTDTLEAKDRNARGQGQGPRTQSASALQKKKKKGLHKNFSGDLHEKTLSKKFFNRSTKF